MIDPTDPLGPQVVASASLDSTLSNGVRINWDVIDATMGYKVTCFLFGGQGGAVVGTTSLLSSPQTVTTGINADLYLLATINGSFGNPVVTNPHFRLAFGFVVNRTGLPQASIGWEFPDNVSTTESRALVRDDSAVAEILSGTQNDARITAISSTGFTIEDGGGTASQDIVYLGMRFADDLDANVVVETLPNAASPPDYSFTSLGLEPQIVIGCSTLASVTGTVVDDSTAGTLGIFLFKAGRSSAHAASNQDGWILNPPFGPATVTKSYVHEQALALLFDDGSVGKLATLVGMLTNGFKLNFSNASAPGGRMIVLGIERYFPPPP